VNKILRIADIFLGGIAIHKGGDRDQEMEPPSRCRLRGIAGWLDPTSASIHDVTRRWIIKSIDEEVIPTATSGCLVSTFYQYQTKLLACLYATVSKQRMRYLGKYQPTDPFNDVEAGPTQGKRTCIFI
jgi:hypothetical protein